MYFRHKRLKQDSEFIGLWGKEYPIFEGFLFIPSNNRMDIKRVIQFRAYDEVTHGMVPESIKKRFLKEYPKNEKELMIKVDKKDKKVEVPA